MEELIVGVRLDDIDGEGNVHQVSSSTHRTTSQYPARYVPSVDLATSNTLVATGQRDRKLVVYRFQDSIGVALRSGTYTLLVSPQDRSLKYPQRQYHEITSAVGLVIKERK